MSGMQHFDHELAELDKQIVRLGNLCGLDATKDETVMRVLEGKILAEIFSADLQKYFSLLKGLLTLRYMVEKQCMDDIGPRHCQEILSGTLLK
ncbi:MAG: hypothetical protein WBL28_06135 [Methylotenera sp.]